MRTLHTSTCPTTQWAYSKLKLFNPIWRSLCSRRRWMLVPKPSPRMPLPLLLQPRFVSTLMNSMDPRGLVLLVAISVGELPWRFMRGIKFVYYFWHLAFTVTVLAHSPTRRRGTFRYQWAENRSFFSRAPSHIVEKTHSCKINCSLAVLAWSFLPLYAPFTCLVNKPVKLRPLRLEIQNLKKKLSFLTSIMTALAVQWSVLRISLTWVR